MSLCILGINGFQGYWLYTTWELTTQQFGRTVREALFVVVRQQQVTDARALVERKGGRVVVREFVRAGVGRERVIVFNHDSVGRPGKSNRVRILNTDSIGQIMHPKRVLITGSRFRVGEPGRQNDWQFNPQSSPASADSLAHSISRILVNDWTTGRSVSLPALAVAYHRELRLREADAPFRLDTLTLGLHAAGPRDTAVSFQLTDSDDEPAGGVRGEIRTMPVPLNPVHDLFVRATFPAPTFYVLRRMGGLLAGSVALLALTTGCFGLMLTTILRQKKLADVKNDFINNMTHELKTPLATVSAAVEALQHFGALDDPQKTQTYLTISRQELGRLAALVDKVLQMATDERHTLTLAPESVRPAELVRELVAHHQLKAAKPVRFEVEMDPEEVVRLDRVHIGNVLNNLLDNALKYSGDQVTVRIRREPDTTGWRLTIADDGLGIPRAHQEAIFDRFFRVPTGNLHSVKGFGLGLHYARQVVERHGGTLTVRSEVGQGSEFTLWLPT